MKVVVKNGQGVAMVVENVAMRAVVKNGQGVAMVVENVAR
jgi:hypothetical protein